MTQDEMTVLLKRTPFCRFLAFDLVSANGDEVSASMKFADRFVGNPILNLYHGGIVASFMEVVASLIVWQDGSETGPKPINLTIDYIRPALPDLLNVSARIAHAGKRMARVETIAWQADPNKVVAKGLFHFLGV
jgi:uncharacterized protein (TIGR00369 family)